MTFTLQMCAWYLVIHMHLMHICSNVHRGVSCLTTHNWTFKVSMVLNKWYLWSVLKVPAITLTSGHLAIEVMWLSFAIPHCQVPTSMGKLAGSCKWPPCDIHLTWTLGLLDKDNQKYRNCITKWHGHVAWCFMAILLNDGNSSLNYHS